MFICSKHIYIYIYIQRERERSLSLYIYICIMYMYMYVYIYIYIYIYKVCQCSADVLPVAGGPAPVPQALPDAHAVLGILYYNYSTLYYTILYYTIIAILLCYYYIRLPRGGRAGDEHALAGDETALLSRGR